MPSRIGPSKSKSGLCSRFRGSPYLLSLSMRRIATRRTKTGAGICKRRLMFKWRQSCALILLSVCALGARANTCAPATVKGTAPSDYQSYCWLDFTGYSDALAQGAGQLFSFSLPDGSTLNLTLQVTTNKSNPALAAHAVPSWTGSAIGHSGFNNIPGEPVLYEVASGSRVNIALSNIIVTPPPGSGATVSYAIIAADGESSNQTESLSFTTNGLPWQQVAQIPNGAVFPTV